MTPRRGLPMLALLVAFAATAQAPRRSGFDDMSAPLQAMQRDDAQNPALLWVAEGASLWAQGDGATPSCASCHGDVAGSMQGVAARYPAFDALAARPLTLAQRIDACRVRHQHAAAWGGGSQPRLALESLIALQSRGAPIAPPDDVRLAPYRARGEAWFRRRIGQLDLSCANCHDQRAGARLGSSLIPQGHPTGYPIYRLEWQSVGDLPRRLRGCMTGVRAEPFDDDAIEATEIALYLAQRAAGMPMDAPAVRP